MNRLLHEVALFTMNAIGMVNLRSSLSISASTHQRHVAEFKPT